LAMACYIFQSNTLYKRNLHSEYWLYNENLKLVSDAEFFIRLAKAKISNRFYNKIIANFRMHDWSSSNNSKLQTKEFEIVKIAIFWKILWTMMNIAYVLAKRILKK